MPSLFSKIISREIPSHIIYEDDAHLAFLDINPLAPGHTLLVPKRESGDVFDLDGEEYSALWRTAHKVAQQLKSATECNRVAVLVLGYEVNHTHIHLIPTQSESDILPPVRRTATQETLAKIAEQLRPADNGAALPTTEMVASRWNELASCFTEKIEPTTVELSKSVFPFLELETAKAVLEIGCGGGAASEAMYDRLPSDSTLTASDVSFEMMGIARERLNDEIMTFLADAQDLPFEDAEYDRILANLNLMLVPDPTAAVREAYRVLRPGGIIVYTVWGRPEFSPLMTVLPDCANALGLQLPRPPRSNFHLGGADTLMQMLRSQGFEHIRQWYQPMVAPITSGSEYLTWNKDMLAKLELSTQKLDALQIKLKQQVDEILMAGLPISLDIRVAVARKPSGP